MGHWRTIIAHSQCRVRLSFKGHPVRSIGFGSYRNDHFVAPSQVHSLAGGGGGSLGTYEDTLEFGCVTVFHNNRMWRGKDTIEWIIQGYWEPPGWAITRDKARRESNQIMLIRFSELFISRSKSTTRTSMYSINCKSQETLRTKKDRTMRPKDIIKIGILEALFIDVV